MSIKPAVLLGAIDLLSTLLTDEESTFTAKGINVTALKDALTATKALLTGSETKQETAKRKLKDATKDLVRQMDGTYDIFSSMVDLLIGAAGKRTNLAKQIQKLRTKARASGAGGSGGPGTSGSP